MSRLVLVSGGLDSAVSLWEAKSKGPCRALWFDYGSVQRFKELESVRAVCGEAGVELDEVSLGFFKDNFKSGLLDGTVMDAESSVVPFRNGVFLSVAAGIALSKGLAEVWSGCHSTTDVYPDCSPAFCRRMSEAVEAGTGGRVRLVFPFADVLKTEVVRRGAELGVPFRLTYSCYKGTDAHCGKCAACLQRKKAFQSTGIEDPTEYEA